MSKELKIAALESSGGLVPDEPVEKEIDWYEVVDGIRVPAKYTVHVRRLSFRAIEGITRRKDQSVVVALVAEGVLFDGGQTKLTPEQADRLDPVLFERLLAAFHEVNGTGKSKESQPGN